MKSIGNHRFKFLIFLAFYACGKAKMEPRHLIHWLTMLYSANLIEKFSRIDETKYIYDNI